MVGVERASHHKTYTAGYSLEMNASVCWVT